MPTQLNTAAQHHVARTEDEGVDQSDAELLHHFGNQVGDDAVQAVVALAARGEKNGRQAGEASSW